MRDYYILVNNVKYGPYNLNQIYSWLNEGKINGNTLCWYQGLEGWKPLSFLFPDFFHEKINTHQEVKKKKRGCMGCFFWTLLILLIFIGLYFLISPYVKDYLEDKRADISYKNFKGTKIEIKGLRKYKTLTKEINWKNKGENLIKYNNVSINLFSPYDEGNQEIKVSSVRNLKIKNGTLITTPVSIELSDKTEYNFPIEILFKNLSDKIYHGNTYLCSAIDEDGKMDYPLSFMGSSNNNLYVISNHLTTFAPFQCKNKLPYSPVMTVPNYFAYMRINIKDTKAVRILRNYNKNLRYMPPSVAMDCWNFFNEWLGVSSNITAFSENALYMEGFKKFNNFMPEFGMSLSCFQLGIDLYTGNYKSGVLNFTKNAGYYGIGKAFPTRAMNIAMVGVFVIDYSLNKYLNEAKSGREKLYENIGIRWLTLRRRKGEKGKWWYKKLKKVVDSNIKNPSNISYEMNKCFKDYVNKLWDNETEIALLHSELNSTAFTAGGGLNKKLKNKLRKELLFQLRSYNKSVVERLGKEYLIKQRNYAVSIKKKMIKFLNKKHKIEIVVVDGKGKRIRSFKGIETGIMVKDFSKRKFWKKEMGESGRVVFYCTNLGYMASGMPHKAYIKIPTVNDKFLLLKKKFTLKSARTTKIKFVFNMDDITGIWKGYYQITKNSYFDSLMKIAPYIFKMVGIKDGAKKLAMAKSVFQEPKGLRRRRQLKITFKNYKGKVLYFAVLEGDGGMAKYKGIANVTRGVVTFEAGDKSGSIYFNGKIISHFLIKGNFRLGSRLFPAASGKWGIEKVKGN